MTEPIILTLLSFIGLLFGAKRLVVGAAALGYLFGVSQAIVGLTILASGVAFPEMFFAVKNDVPSYSNVANLGLVLSLAFLFNPMTIHSRLLQTATLFLAIGLMIITTLLLHHHLTHLASFTILAIIIGMAGWLTFTIISQGIHRQHHIDHPGIPTDLPIWQALVSILLGIIFVFLCGYTLQNTTTLLFPSLETFSQCLPELAIALFAARLHESDLLVGMLIGSSSINVLLTLPLTALEKSRLDIGPDGLLLIGYQLILSVLLFLVIHYQIKITRLMAAALLVSFFGLVYISPLL